MKKLFAVLLSALSIAGYSQTLEIGGRGGVSSFWLLNSSTSNAGNTESKKLSLSYNGGLHLAYDITDNIGIETNFLYASLNQAYSGSFSRTGVLPDGNLYASNQTYNSKINLTAYQIPLLLCFETYSGSFVELGAQYDMIQGANYTGNFSNPTYTSSFNAGNNFAKSAISGVFGVGGKYSVTDYIFILTDFRFTYSFTDVQGVDGLGQPYNTTPYYSNIKPTNAFNASINVGVFYLVSLSPGYRVGHKCKGTPKVRSGRSHS